MEFVRWLPAGTRLIRDEVGHVGPERHSLDPVRPHYDFRLHGKMKLIADVGPGSSCVRGGSVTRPRIWIAGVDLPPVRPDAERLRPFGLGPARASGVPVGGLG